MEFRYTTNSFTFCRLSDRESCSAQDGGERLVRIVFAGEEVLVEHRHRRAVLVCSVALVIMDGVVGKSFTGKTGDCGAVGNQIDRVVRVQIPTMICFYYSLFG